MESAHPFVLMQNTSPFQKLYSVRENNLMFVSFSFELDNSVCVANDYGLNSWVSIPRRGKRFNLYSTASRPDLGTTQPPIQWVPWTLSLRVELMKREADHSPPSSDVINKAGAVIPLPRMFSWLKHKDSFSFISLNAQLFVWVKKFVWVVLLHISRLSGTGLSNKQNSCNNHDGQLVVSMLS
jgi:hypothetical protein